MLVGALKRPIVVFFVLAGNAIMATCACAFYWVERDTNPAVRTLGDAFWWAMSTVTTVGFGDVVPVTGTGRWIAALLMVTGIVFFVGFTALLSSAVSIEIAHEVAEHELPASRLDLRRLEQQIASLREELREARKHR